MSRTPTLWKQTQQRGSAEVLEKIMNNYSQTAFPLLFFLFLRLSAGIGANQDECEVPSCSPGGPAIRFPFRRKDQPSHCGYPGFVISCTGKETILELPHSVKLSVDKIKYKSQEIVVHDPEFCLQRQLQNFTLSASPFQFKIRHFFASEIRDFTFFSCSSNKSESNIQFQSIPCRFLDRNPVYAVSSYVDLDSIDVSSCQKLYSLSLPDDIGGIFDGKDHFTLSWSEGICGSCEKAGKKCRLKRNSKVPETECLPKGAKEKILIAGIILGFFALVVVTILLHHVHRSNKSKKESIVRVEKFLEDYKALKPSRYSYNDIRKLTNHFKDKLGQGGYGTVYKGKLSNEVLVAVKILNDAKGNGDEFINEVGTIGGIHHVNIVRLVGFCADGAKRALIYEFLPNESLEKFIFSTSIKHPSLGWEKLQDIARGIAKGIEYLHQGCDQRILHFDIKPHNILLDENFNPKISDFGLAKLCSKDQSAVSMTIARGTMGYIAPEVLSRNFGNVSCKSDVYSFGMVLLEMVGGRKNIDRTMGTDQIFFPEWLYHQMEQGEDLHIRSVKEEDIKIIKKLTIVGLWCIQWHPVDRPSMKVVVQMLERGENLAIPPNPFASIGSAEGGGNIRRRKRYVQQELTIISE